jgi:thiamine biosynthesis lipoprotein
MLPLRSHVRLAVPSLRFCSLGVGRAGRIPALFHATSVPRIPLQYVAAFLALVSLMAHRSEAATVSDGRHKMGSQFQVTAVHEREEVAWEALEAGYAEIDRLEEMISSWRESSETSAVNRAAGIRPVAVSEELFNLVRRALKISELTDGAFDITFAGAGKLWDFNAEEPSLPGPKAVAAALEVVDYRRVRLDEETRTIFLEKAGMRIGFGAIGKGFAANRAVLAMQRAGVEGGVVNAGGDLVAFGRKEDGSPWTVAIVDPANRDEIFAYIEVAEQAVVTSGDYESFIEIEGVRYAHILDPRTGYPSRGVRSVTVVCPDAELADALATSIFVLGKGRGLALIDELNGIEALVIDDAGELSYSRELRSLLIE